MEILDRIHLIPLGGAGEVGAGPSTSVYYVQGQDRGAFIDSGFPDEERTRPLVEYWRQSLAGAATGWVLVSHRHYEHSGGVKILKQATGARIGAGGGDVEAIEAQFGSGTSGVVNVVDDSLEGDEVFDLGGRRMRVIATPGHTAGTVCFFLEDEGILFTGDHIMGRGTVVIRSDEGGSMAQHIDSLRKLLDLDLKLILSGHGPAILEPRVKIQEVVQHRLEREGQILGLLGEGITGVDALMARAYGNVTERLAFLARHQVVAHLKKLEEEGRAVAIEAGSRYRPA